MQTDTLHSWRSIEDVSSCDGFWKGMFVPVFQLLRYSFHCSYPDISTSITNAYS